MPTFSRTQKLAELLIKHEGLKLFPYWCTAGKLTIGIGRNLEDRGITKDEALMLLENDIKDFTKQLSKNLYWFDDQPEIVQIVMLDMCFNLGISGFLQFRKTLEHLKNNNYKSAAREMLKSKWAQQVGVRAIELSDMIKNL